MDAPVFEKRYNIEYNINCESKSLSAKLGLADNALTKAMHTQTSRQTLNESITAPSRHSFLLNSFIKVAQIYKELNLNNERILNTSIELLQSCAVLGKTNLNISKTSQEEILIYTSKNGNFNNVLIDEDGDISLLRVGDKKENKYTAFYSANEKIDFNSIVSFL
ncbi:MAG: hypothetical protein PSX36_03070 [bacterium]|nr:hypothetical protein [bacterium]